MKALGRAAGLFALVTAVVVSTIATTPRTASACICNSDGKLSEHAERIDVASVGRPIFDIVLAREDYPDEVATQISRPDHGSTPVKGLIITPFAVAAGIFIAYVLAKRGARRNPAPAESPPEGGG